MTKIAPHPTPETRHYWEAANCGEFLLQKCADCAHIYFPPRPFCPVCISRDVRAFAASGRATLYSYVINHLPRPDWPDEPYAVAIVELEEGPRMISNIVGVEQTPEALVLDMALEVTFERLNDDIALPVFRPAKPNVEDTKHG